MTRNEFIRRFPNASQSAIRANTDPDGPGLCAPIGERPARNALVGKSKGKASRRVGPAGRIRILFRVFSVRPGDWDNYRTKDLQDLLIEAGLLPGDSWDLLQGSVVPEKAHSKAEEKTIVEITYPEPIVAEQPPLTPRGALIETLWSQCNLTWNRQAFDAFVETMTESDLQQYAQMGRT